MAKKGQAVQLQIEVNNDEEWEKLLQKEGLIDVYSEWCGPCLGMQANLKKVKLEYGADVLHLAIAKSDGITALERFRNKSEPTWMFISKGKMIGLMFGANAPKLTRLMIEELKKEQALSGGQPVDRVPMEVTELAEEEKVRHDAVETVQRAIREKEERKRAKELLERRTKECDNILTNLPNYGTALIFPSARDKYKEVLNEILDEAGLVINQTEKICLDEKMISDLCFFTDESHEFSEEALEELINNQSLMILFKIAPRSEVEDIDNALLTMFYGHSKHPPGEAGCAAARLVSLIEETEEQAKKELTGVWVPRTPKVRATAIKMFFPKISSDFTIPEPPPEPEHLAIIFPLRKKDEVLAVMQQYSHEVMRHGVFTTENPDNTKLVSKTLRKLEKVEASQRTYDEKLVLQVSKQKSECIFMFAQLEPLHMSPNAKEGKIECEKFFPDDFEPETEEQAEEEIAEEDGKQDEGSAIEENADALSAEPREVEGSVTQSEAEVSEIQGSEKMASAVELEGDPEPTEGSVATEAIDSPDPPSEEPLAET